MNSVGLLEPVGTTPGSVVGPTWHRVYFGPTDVIGWPPGRAV